MAVPEPVEKCVHLPAALEQWAAEHNEQLSPATIAEVRRIADALAGSDLGTRPIGDLTAGSSVAERIGPELGEIFPQARAERAATLIQVVADWWTKRTTPPATALPGEAPPAAAATSPTTASAIDDPASEPQSTPEHPSAPASEPAPAPVSQPLPRADRPDERVAAAPAFLRSDRVDEEDDVRLYGPKRRWKGIVATVAGLALLAGAAAGGWYWFTQRDDTQETVTATPEPVTPEPDVDQTPDQTDETGDATTAPTTLPTAEPEPTPEPPSAWADVGPILNSGTTQITASTYAVSPANRAVLTGHQAAITGVAISDDGRVLTAGADRRLVDWGSDVTLANPDVLNVPAPLTVLSRTADEHLLAGDADGSLTVLDLAAGSDPMVLPIHTVAVSAVAELPDGRVAVASADGDVAVFSLDSPDEQLSLPHDVEVTAVVGLDDGTIATAAVDGVVRVWAADGQGEPGRIETLNAPVTAMALLADGRLATASIDGAIHIVPAVADPDEVVVLAGHIGAVRALFEVTLPSGASALTSGGDDTTIRLWDLGTRAQVGILEGHGDIISGLDVLPDGRLVSTSGDGTGRVWDLSLEPAREVISSHDSNLSAMSPWQDDRFITGGTDGKVILAGTGEGTEPLVVTEHDASIVGVARLQSGDILSLDATSVLRINQSDADPAGQIELQLGAGATALAVRAGEGIVTGHADGTVRFHDLAEETLVVDAHGSGVNDVIALSNGLVVSAGQDRTVRIIDPENPGQLPVFDLHTAPVDVVAELPDGRIASSGSDGIYVFSVESLGQDQIRLNGQRARTISLLGLAGDRLISTGDDGRIRLWDLTTPEAEPTTLIDIPGIVNPYLIQADDGLFVAGAARGYVVFTPI